MNFINLKYMLAYYVGIAIGESHGDYFAGQDYVGMGANSALFIYWNRLSPLMRWFLLGYLTVSTADTMETFTEYIKGIIPGGSGGDPVSMIPDQKGKK